MAKERISLHDFLEQQFCDATSDHLYTLRERLLEAGYIQTITQKYVYTEAAMNICLEWFLDDLARQDDEGSTGSWGKQFEVESRISYAKRRGVPFRISDTKCRPAGVRDMTIRVDGGNYVVELKTGNGAVGYGPDRASANEAMQDFFKRNPIICWDFECNGDPLCMKAYDLLKELAHYKCKGEEEGENKAGNILTWFTDNPNYNKAGEKLNRSYQINFAVTPGPKMDYLRALRDSNKSFSWKRMVDWAEFATEE